MNFINFRTYQLAIEFYQQAEHLKLKSPLKDQFARSLLSIPLNLAEGSAKPTAKDRRKFYRISLGSLREVQTILHLTNHQDLQRKADLLAAHLYNLCLKT